MSEPPNPQPCPARSDEDFAVTSIAGDAGLVAEGWVRRHLADASRAQEWVDLYRSTGYEVMVQRLTPEDFGPQCAHCASVVCGACVLIYTRQPKP